MIYLCILIIVFVVFGLYTKPNKTILIYGILNILLQDYICVRYESPAIMLHFAVDVIIISYCILNKKFSLRDFPLYKPYKVLFCLMLLGVIVSSFPLSSTIPSTINALSPYIIVVLFYSELRTKEDSEFAFKLMLILLFFMSVYSLVEFILQENPISEYCYATIPPDLLKGKLYLSYEYRFISVRCSSLMSISIAWGGLCCLIASSYFCVSSFTKDVKKWLLLTVLTLLIFNVIISGSRSPMIYLIVILIGYLWSTKVSVKFILLIFAVLFYFFSPDLLNPILNSFTSSDTEVTGSSIELRINQYDAIMSILSQSPIWGFGAKGLLLAFKSNSDILGAESIWFQQLITGGIIGLFCQAYMYVFILKFVIKTNVGITKLMCALMVIGWIIFCSLTTAPGLTEAYFITICLLTIKYIHLHRECGQQTFNCI